MSTSTFGGGDGGFDLLGAPTGATDADSFLPISMQLITPIQRPPRYKMLLDDLAGHTWPDHCDAGPVAAAVDLASHVGQAMDSAVGDGDETAASAETPIQTGAATDAEKELHRIAERLGWDAEMLQAAVRRPPARPQPSRPSAAAAAAAATTTRSCNVKGWLRQVDGCDGDPVAAVECFRAIQPLPPLAASAVAVMAVTR